MSHTTLPAPSEVSAERHPRFVQVKLALMYELSQNRPLIVNWVRLAIDPRRATTRLLDRHTLVYRPEQDRGRFAMDPVPDDDLWQTPGLVIDCHSLVTIDPDGRASPPDTRCSRREQGFFSADEETFLHTMLNSSIEHLVLCHAAAAPQFGPRGDTPPAGDGADGIQDCLQHIFVTDTLSPDRQEQRYRFDIDAAMPELGDPDYSLLTSDDLAIEYAQMRGTATRLRMVGRTAEPGRTAPFVLTAFYAGTAEQVHQRAADATTADRRDRNGRQPIRPASATPRSSAPSRFQRTKQQMEALQRTNDAIARQAHRLLASAPAPEARRTLDGIAAYFEQHRESIPRDPATDSPDPADHMSYRNEYVRNRSLTYLKVVELSMAGERLVERGRAALDQLASLVVLNRDRNTRERAMQLWSHVASLVADLEDCIKAGEGSVLGLTTAKRMDRLAAVLSRDGQVRRFVDQEVDALGACKSAVRDACWRLIDSAEGITTPSHERNVMAERLMQALAGSCEEQVLDLRSIDLSRRTLTVRDQASRLRRALKKLELMLQGPDFDAGTLDWPPTYRRMIKNALRELVLLGQMVLFAETQAGAS